MKHSLQSLGTLLALFCLGLLSACSNQAATEPIVPTEVTRGPRLTPTATNSALTDDATPEAQQDVTTAGQSNKDEACLSCHANAEMLQTLAVEEEPVESLSSGEG